MHYYHMKGGVITNAVYSTNNKCTLCAEDIEQTPNHSITNQII